MSTYMLRLYKGLTENEKISALVCEDDLSNAFGSPLNSDCELRDVRK